MGIASECIQTKKKWPVNDLQAEYSILNNFIGKIKLQKYATFYISPDHK